MGELCMPDLLTPNGFTLKWPRVCFRPLDRHTMPSYREKVTCPWAVNGNPSNGTGDTGIQNVSTHRWEIHTWTWHALTWIHVRCVFRPFAYLFRKKYLKLKIHFDVYFPWISLKLSILKLNRARTFRRYTKILLMLMWIYARHKF